MRCLRCPLWVRYHGPSCRQPRKRTTKRGMVLRDEAEAPVPPADGDALAAPRREWAQLLTVFSWTILAMSAVFVTGVVSGAAAWFVAPAVAAASAASCTACASITITPAARAAAGAIVSTHAAASTAGGAAFAPAVAITSPVCAAAAASVSTHAATASSSNATPWSGADE